MVVLLDAHREEIPDHLAYRDWLEDLIHSPQAYGLTDLVVSSFFASPPTAAFSIRPARWTRL